MTRNEELLWLWTDTIAAEIAVRRAAPAQAADDARARLYAQLDEMAARCKATAAIITAFGPLPDYVEPSPEEKAAIEPELTDWFRRQGYISAEDPSPAPLRLTGSARIPVLSVSAVWPAAVPDLPQHPECTARNG